jgi:hypothetical protein
MAETPLIVAHRAGNDSALLTRALHAGSGLIEADVPATTRSAQHGSVRAAIPGSSVPRIAATLSVLVALPQLVAWCCRVGVILLLAGHVRHAASSRRRALCLGGRTKLTTAAATRNPRPAGVSA